MDPRDVKIVSPCSADWEAMRPDAGGTSRHCERCDMRVHDLSAMTRREARVFLEATAGHRICLSYLERASGERIFADEPGGGASSRWADVVPVARLRARTHRPAAPLVKSVMVGALAACAPHGEVEALVMDEAETEATLMQEVRLEADLAKIPDAARATHADRRVEAETPCDPVGTEDQVDPVPETKHPRPITRTAGIPMQISDDMLAKDPLSL